MAGLACAIEVGPVVVPGLVLPLIWPAGQGQHVGPAAGDVVPERAAGDGRAMVADEVLPDRG
jgi:hypothetical protein